MEIRLKQFFSVAALAVGLLVMAEFVFAQELVQAARTDGAKTPLRVYTPNAAGCAPLALISPGAGGSEDGYKYLAEALRDAGWRAVVMGHKESGEAALRSDMKDSGGIRKGVRELVNDPAAYSARLMDIKAALDWAAPIC